MAKEFSLRGLDRAVAFKVLTLADELMRSSSVGRQPTRAEAVAQAREDLSFDDDSLSWASRSMLRHGRLTQ
jgi:hypothetical protein